MTQKVHFLCAVVEGPGCHNGYSESCWEPRVPGIPDPHGLGSDIPPGLLADALRHDKTGGSPLSRLEGTVAEIYIFIRVVHVCVRIVLCGIV